MFSEIIWSQSSMLFPATGLCIFFVTMIAVTAWAFRPGSRQRYDNLQKQVLDLQDSNSSRESHS